MDIVTTRLAVGNSGYKVLQGLTVFSRLVLGVVFGLAGLAKLGVPQAMVEDIKSYDMNLPSGVITFMANVLPALELGIGVWLLIGLFTRFAAGISAVLSVIFSIAIGQAWLRGLDISCGCFGGPTSNELGKSIILAMGSVGDFLTHEKAGPDTVLRDVIFLAMALLLVFVPSPFSVDSLRRRYNHRADEAYDGEVGD